ncbi:RNA polymerase sigma factor [Amycolatopsis sp. YIM 10]|uniref:RNA polymerase sigma factor n=1 Tax=Amycolatopsis sp. YIM 10 TaxID=2653857 RepID=UPI00129048BD|nr:sigma factor-like helix-turn-helix DNA-binding protein [Amycolatopsis sp. YIM 10]
MGWLITTARRNAARVVRGEMRTTQLSEEMASRVESTLPAPEAEVLRSDHGRQMWRAFGRLSHRDQKLLWLPVIDQESHQDVARELGLSAGSVGPLGGRALRRLRELLKNEE